jgi:two-component system, response regulator PdtaR
MNTKLNILIVEDDTIIGLNLAKILASFGYNILGPINTGEEVIEKLNILNPDLILMDIKLKGKIDGIKTAEQIQQKAALPIVFLTGLTDDEYFQRAKLLNPYGYLIKPFEGNELRTTIELTLHRFKNTVNHEEELEENHFELNNEPNIVDNKDLSYFLSTIPIFSNLSVDTMTKFANNCSIKHFNSGEIIYLEGDKSKGGFIPLSGRISIMKSTYSGKELIVALLAPGDILGIKFVSDIFCESLSARTQTISKVLWIPPNVLKTIRNLHSEIEETLNEILTNYLTVAYDLASSLAHSTVEERILNTLLSLMQQFGKNISNKDNGSVSSRIYITRKELSELTGTTPETAYRVTKNLEREKLLDLSRPGILKINDIRALERACAKI